MLDDLVAEARDRWGLDVSAGIQIVPAEGLTATPIDPSAQPSRSAVSVLVGS